MINLENKNIILTGATGGIGNSIVDTLASLNAKLVVTVNEKRQKSVEWPLLHFFLSLYQVGLWSLHQHKSSCLFLPDLR